MIGRLKVMGKKQSDDDWEKGWKMPPAQLFTEAGEPARIAIDERYKKWLADNRGGMPQSLLVSGLSGEANAETPASVVPTGNTPNLTPDVETSATNAVGAQDVVTASPPGTEPRAKAQVPQLPARNIPDHAAEAGIAGTSAKGKSSAEPKSEDKLIVYRVDTCVMYDTTYTSDASVGLNSTALPLPQRLSFL